MTAQDPTPPDVAPEIRVRDVPEDARYVLTLDDTVAGYAEYRLDDDVVVFTHTRIQPEHEGQGLGSALVRAALADARRRHLAVVGQCPFVAAYLSRHPGEADVLER